MSLLESSPIIRNEPDHILRNYLAISSQIHIEGKIDELKSSPIRRTFCLIVLVDLIMCLLLWIIRMHEGNINSYSKDVLYYNFGTSLFDIVMLVLVRFTFLEIMYGGVKSKSYWWISLSTTVSSAFAIVKMFKSNICNVANNKMLFDYIIILITILFAWIETLFLVCRMIPKERAAEQVVAYQKSLSEHFAKNTEYLTSIDMAPRSGKVLLLEQSMDDEFFSPAATRPESPTQFRVKEIQQEANELHHKSMAVINNNTGWTYAAGDAVQGCVTYKELVSYKGKMFKVETLLNVAADVLYNDMVENVEMSPTWNRHVRLVKRVEHISSNVDIIYNLSNEALNGYISPRDFVLLRTWCVMDQCYLICMKSIVHEDCPLEPNVVRGEYGLGAVFLQASTVSQDQCRCTWLMNNDIKGRLFKSIVDKAVPGILLEIIRGLSQYCAGLNITV